jgi:hypothetical protein
MNLFIKQTDPKKTCDGCNNTVTRESAFGYCCAECESYLTVHEHLGVNFAVHLEEFRERHGLTRKAACRVASEFLDLRDDLLDAAMDGYSFSEAREEEPA